jgi:hypothetical protein
MGNASPGHFDSAAERDVLPFLACDALRKSIVVDCAGLPMAVSLIARRLGRSRHDSNTTGLRRLGSRHSTIICTNSDLTPAMWAVGGYRCSVRREQRVR